MSILRNCNVCVSLSLVSPGLPCQILEMLMSHVIVPGAYVSDPLCENQPYARGA